MFQSPIGTQKTKTWCKFKGLW